MAVIYYTESTPISNSSGNVVATATSATLTSVPGRMAYITGFTITGAGATAASVVSVTVTGVVGGTMTYILAVPAGATTGVSLQVNFPMPIPATAANTNIVVNVPGFGTGNLFAAVVAYGYLK